MKKKMLVIFCCFCFLLLKLSGNIVQAEKGEDEPTNLYARSAVLMDADSGRILFGKDERRKLPMASTTKIMTCILAVSYTHLDVYKRQALHHFLLTVVQPEQSNVRPSKVLLHLL